MLTVLFRSVGQGKASPPLHPVTISVYTCHGTNTKRGAGIGLIIFSCTAPWASFSMLPNLPMFSVIVLALVSHFVAIGTGLSRPRPPRTMVKCRNTKAIGRSQFRAALSNSGLVSAPPDTVNDIVDFYKSVPSNLLDRYAPEKEKVVPDRPSSPWMNYDIIKAKQARRRAEGRKRKSGLVVRMETYKQARNNVTAAVKHAKASYFQAKLK